jgi:hypothetical protein
MAFKHNIKKPSVLNISPFTACVPDTGGAPLIANVFASVEKKIQNGANWAIRGLGKNDL